ncbi:MAG: hypothetical protein HKN33_07850 [Pyrinomonadaceae bacterium]|nr:hypothetical protein [Pyrinomonadaceae bacterium]
MIETLKHSRALRHAFIFVMAIVFVFAFSNPNPTAQTSPGDETPEETLSRSSRNLHQWGTISSFHGLPSERVRAITQTAEGFIWFATDNGLAKFDGRRVRTDLYSNLASVPIRALEVADDNTLWIGSQKGAYFVRDGSFNLIETTEGSTITSIFIDKDAVFLTSDTGIVYRCSESEGAFTTTVLMRDEVPLQAISRIGPDLILGSQNSGLLSIEDGSSKRIITRPSPFFINVLKRDLSEKLWVGARSSFGNSGLFVIDKLPGLRLLGENLGTVNSIAFDPNGNAWIGTDERGIFYFEGEELRKRYTFSNTSGSLRSNQILAVFVDREGVIWIGTDEGVNRFDPYSPRNERVSDNTQSNFVRVVETVEDGVQLAGTNRGLYISKGEGLGWQNVVEAKTIYAIRNNGKEKWLFGTPLGLFEYNAKTGSTEEVLEDGDIRAISKFRGSTYVADFGRGLLRVEADGASVLLRKKVVSLHADENRTLWIGTTEGELFSYDGNKMSDPIPMAEDKKAAIWSIAGNAEDGIWLSTNKGLFLRKEGTIQALLQELNVRETVMIKDAEGNMSIWCAAEEGLFALKFDENYGWISSSSDIEQGFASQNMFSLAAPSDSSILIGTNRGIVRKAITRIPPYITADRVLSQRLHQPSELATGIILEYPQNTLSVEVTALSSRTFPEEFQYSFLLFDSNDEIVTKRFTDREEFLMENLDPGEYRVEIRAFDRNLTNSEPLIFTLLVEDAPFPLIATVLGILLLIAVAALIWATISQRQIFRTSRELANANTQLNTARLDLANEAERERHRIARDLHDQTLADLRHLLLIADEVPTERTGEFRTQIEGVSEEIRRICEDLSPSVLENIGFTAALEWELSNAVEQVSDVSNIETEFEAADNLDESLKLNRAEQIQIYRIAQEILNNMVRHSSPHKITLRVGLTDEGVLELEIADDGIGFDPEKVTRKKGRGLTNIKARAQLIKAEIEWQRPETGGTVFSLRK